MWYPSTTTVPPSVEPVTIEQAKQQCRVDTNDDDALLTRLIKAARAHAEEYCNARWAEQTVVSECDSFSDFARLSEGPLKSVGSVSYVDPAGAAETVEDTVYEPRKDGLEPSIGLKPGQAWPRIRPGSRIALTAVYGGGVPESVQHAMLVWIEDAYLNRENAQRLEWTVFDALLCNHRRGA
ncbi:Phage gp6-like head-tail connector protein [Aminobacter sp. MSH1]|uniref:head-tail connector protein n=1 Tax=Aminobacter sp. MSH1 TaxID=374606 RepID=UPI000D37BD8C|nr:head-tail connector protein [Aminobacter sp. MSH1]AWC25458.1 Phage gp6-like head-tail connector protein [Aminobacter sp. MSH1]